MENLTSLVCYADPHPSTPHPAQHTFPALLQRIPGDHMVLLDGGCEYHGYCSDVSRTWPTSSKYRWGSVMAVASSAAPCPVHPLATASSSKTNPLPLPAPVCQACCVSCAVTLACACAVARSGRCTRRCWGCTAPAWVPVSLDPRCASCMTSRCACWQRRCSRSEPVLSCRLACILSNDLPACIC